MRNPVSFVIITMIKKILISFLVIIFVLFIYVFYMVFTSTGEDPCLKAENDIMTLSTAIQFYKLDNGMYPSTEQGLLALIKKTKIKPLPTNWRLQGYLDSDEKLIDPWGNEYQYYCPGKHGDFDIFSLGKDNKIGGEHQNMDINNWEIN